MSTTIPTEFPGLATLTPDKVLTLKDWYISALGDMDKASDIEDAIYNWGWSDATESILNLLHDTNTEGMKLSKVIIKPGRRILTKKNIIIGATVFVLYKNRKHLKAASDSYAKDSKAGLDAMEKKYGTRNAFKVMFGTNHKTV